MKKCLPQGDLYGRHFIITKIDLVSAFCASAWLILIVKQ